MSTSISNQIFDWGRFTAALRKEVVENKRQLILIAVSVFLIFLISMVLGNVLTYTIFKAHGEIYKHFTDLVPIIIVTTCYAYIAMIVASLAFRNLTSQAGRVALFTSPTSTTEKFIVNLLIYVIGAFLMTLICALLASLVHIAVLTPFESKTFYVARPLNILSIMTSDSPGNTFSLTRIKDTLEGYGYSMMDFRWMILLGVILKPAIYFMGRVLWPRWAVLKTFAAERVIDIIISIIVMLIFAQPILYGISNDTLVDTDTSQLSTAINISNYINYVILAVCWYGAWYLFKHKDVVSLKWWS